ncbi:hypothetical protein HO133_009863 [Letharia lupina]|uniref:Uncharacterized protein n=1 Tax=Letharia lupina TaxID=560253 RepID=A0A8H6FF61_9LECA|nr:uncharacterized protein HO133_009863 [Letharia lupina]KAF6225861.1 hypothetical protein HO133_009863 [Letharia lupina]
MVVSRADFIDVIRDITRGWEMPGTFSPLTVGNLFGHKSQPQLQPARQHLKPVSQAARSSLDLLKLPLGRPNRPPKPSLTTPIDRKLKDTIQNLDEILTPYKTGHPITYNTITASPRTIRQTGPKLVRVLASNLTQKPHPCESRRGRKKGRLGSTIDHPQGPQVFERAFHSKPRSPHVSISRSDQIGQTQARFVGSRRGPDADDVEALSDAERMYGWAVQNCRRAIADTEVLLQETEGNASFCQTTRAKLRYPQR